MARTATESATPVFATVDTPLYVVGLQVLIIAHAFLQLGDLATTYIALGAGGYEANPLSRMVIEDAGWLAYGAIKFGVAGAFLALWKVPGMMHINEARIITAAMTLFGLFMTFVVINNATIAF